jgi:hypothetical protein
MIKYATAIRTGTEAILRRFTKANAVHPAYQAMAETGRAQRTIFLARCLRDRDLQREINEGLNVVESWNRANAVIFFGKGGEMQRGADEHDLRDQHGLMAVLPEAIGIDEAGRHPLAGAAVILDAAIGAVSTQRIALQRQADGHALCTWPAEVKPQAEAPYQTGKGPAAPGFVAQNPGGMVGQAKRAPRLPGRACCPTAIPALPPPDHRLRPPLVGKRFRSGPRAPLRRDPGEPGPSSGSASTPTLRMTSSSIHFFGASAATTLTYVLASICGASGPGRRPTISMGAACWPARCALRSLNC